MSRLKLYNDCDNDATLVSNRFIDDFMTDANDAQLKIYLYLIRMLGANQATSISAIADKFNHTEKDVIRSLKYWERMKLLHLDYDEQLNITGIHIQDLDKMPVAEIVPLSARKIPSHTADSVSDMTTAAKTVPPAQQPSEPAQSADTASIVDEPQFIKPSYSADDLKAAKKDEVFSRIRFVAEQYLQKPLQPADVKTLLFIYKELQFSEDLIDYLVEYCVGLHKTSHHYIEKVAISWAEAEVKTVDDAKNQASAHDKSVYTILNALGNKNAPTEAEATLIRKWNDQYNFSMEIILEACRRSVFATTGNRMNYADRILESWFKANVHTFKDIDALDAAHAQKNADRPERKALPKQSVSNNFNQFEQRPYNYEELEQALLSN